MIVGTLEVTQSILQNIGVKNIVAQTNPVSSMVEAPIDSPDPINMPKSARVVHNYNDEGLTGIEAIYSE